MTYVLLLTRGAWQDGPPAEQAQVFARIGAWWGERVAEGTIVGGHKLTAPDTATTLLIDGARTTIVDGPFIESKDAIGGFAVIEARDLEQAIAVARTFPVPDGQVEVRPAVA